MVRHGPPGTIGSSYPSGWMTDCNFLLFIKHLIKHVRPSKDKPMLLLLDNHQSHLSIDVLNECKENGVVMLSFPPHCSHKLQPLDRTVYGPLKTFLSNAQTSWMRNNPGGTMNIHDIPFLLSSAFPLAFTPTNIMSGFRVSGICPFNRDIFTENDFAPAFVTDRPLDEEMKEPTEEKASVEEEIRSENEDSLTREDKNNFPLANDAPRPDAAVPSTSGYIPLNVHTVSPLPRAPPRKIGNKGRNRSLKETFLKP